MPSALAQLVHWKSPNSTSVNFGDDAPRSRLELPRRRDFGTRLETSFVSPLRRFAFWSDSMYEPTAPPTNKHPISMQARRRNSLRDFTAGPPSQTLSFEQYWT